MGHRFNAKRDYSQSTGKTANAFDERIDVVPAPRANPELNASRFRFEPYNARCAVVPIFDAADIVPAAVKSAKATAESAPAGTLHMPLWGKVSFTPYPTTEFLPDAPANVEGPTARVFLGQLPYHVTDMQLNWLCHTFGGNQMVHSPERIMKKQANGDRLPTGCIHAYCPAKSVSALVTGMHKRLLVDDTGVWHARTQPQVEALEEYVQTMKIHKNRRAPHRPYDTVVVQLAHSTYVPKTQATVPAHPATSPQRASYNVSPPPYNPAPAYNQAQFF